MFSVYLGTGGTHILSGAWYNREIVVLRRYLTLEFLIFHGQKSTKLNYSPCFFVSKNAFPVEICFLCYISIKLCNSLCRIVADFSRNSIRDTLYHVFRRIAHKN